MWKMYPLFAIEMLCRRASLDIVQWMLTLATPLWRRLPLVAWYIRARGYVAAFAGEGASAVKAVKNVATRAILVSAVCVRVRVMSFGFLFGLWP